MFSPFRSLCFNDDRQTFTIVLPSQYRIFRCDPFGMIFSRECEDLSLGTVVATYDGYRYIALTGAPSLQNFNSKSVRVFDHQTGQKPFEHTFPDHILSLGIGKNIIVVCMYMKTEVWNMSTKQMLYSIGSGKNVHAPLAISPNSSSIIIGGSNERSITIYRGIESQLQPVNAGVDETAVSLVKFSDDCHLFATSGFTGDYIRVWDFKSLALVATLERGAKEDVVMAIDFSPSGDFLASISKDGLLRIFDIRKRNQNPKKPTKCVCSENLGQPQNMPRFTWLNSMLLGLASLEGDYYKISFDSSSLEFEKIPFLKRTV